MGLDSVSLGQSTAKPRKAAGDLIAEALASTDGLHIVERGETARGIAKEHEIPWADFKTWNAHVFSSKVDEHGHKRRTDGSLLYPGDEIRLTAPGRKRPSKPEPTKPEPAKPDPKPDPAVSGTDRMELKAASVARAKRAIDTAEELFGQLDQLGLETAKGLFSKVELAIGKIPVSDPDYAKYKGKVEGMKAKIDALEHPEPTAEQKEIAKAKTQLHELSAALAGTHGRDQAAASEIMGQAEAALAKIPANDPEHAACQKIFDDMKGLFTQYFPPIDPQIAIDQGSLGKYLSDLDAGKVDGHQASDKRSATVSLVNSQPQLIKHATAEQQLKLVENLLGRRGDDVISLIGGGSMNDKTRRATVEVLKAAAAGGQLDSVLAGLGKKKDLDELFTQMSDGSPGVEMAKLFMSAGVYDEAKGFYKQMDDDATGALLKAAGYVDPPPPMLKSEFLDKLPVKVRQHMIEELAGGNYTWEESRMADWLAKHGDPKVKAIHYSQENDGLN